MGSLCCVAARPHGTSTASREWSSIDRSDPRTNAGFSPPLSRTWEYRINSEGLSYGSHGDSGVAANYGSSLSSNSKEASRSWERNELPPDHRYSTSEGAISYFNSPDISFQNHHIMLPMLQDSSIDEYVRVSAAEPIGALLLSEGMSGHQNSGGSTSSRSDGSEYDIVPKSYSSTPRNFPSRLSFLSKPVHPLSFPEHELEAQEIPVANASSNNPLRSDLKGTGELHFPGLMDYGSGSHGESANWSVASSMDLTDFSERPEAERAGPLRPNNVMEKTRCDLCDRLLTKRSPWGSRRIIRTGDLPVAGVLPCCHVYHAECLERTTPKGQKHDPPCPVCDKLAGKDTEQWSICRLKNGLPRLHSLGEGPSRVWSCAQAGDCVTGAVQMPRSSSISLLSRGGHKRHASSKGEPGRD
uniref:RING-type domain-containing protein n=1 Tax=Arundo donax TaxID=35708 RepID=A0A0A8YGS8_ARUDO